jgi:hypothetical protein
MNPEYGNKKESRLKRRESVQGIDRMKTKVLKSFLTSLFTLDVALATFAKDRPNVLFILSGDHAYEAVGFYGY